MKTSYSCNIIQQVYLKLSHFPADVLQGIFKKIHIFQLFLKIYSLEILFFVKPLQKVYIFCRPPSLPPYLPNNILQK